MNSREDKLIQRISRQERQHARRQPREFEFEDVYRHFLDRFRKPEYMIRAVEFQDVYNKKQLTEYFQRLNEAKAGFNELSWVEQQNIKLATIFEGIMVEFSELGNWLGEDVKVVKTLAYDDIVNGIDLYVQGREYKDENGETVPEVLFGIDVTYTCNLNDTRRLERKLQRIASKIKGGVPKLRNGMQMREYLPHVDFYRDLFAKEAHSGIYMPGFVVFLRKSMVEELARAYQNGERSKLSGHSVQKEILQQIYAQATAMADWIETHTASAPDKVKKEIASVRYRVLKRIEKIQEDFNFSEISENTAILLSLLQKIYSLDDRPRFSFTPSTH